MKIGFFDSGHGGLDILEAAMKSAKGDYYFIGDRANHPYGALPIEELRERCCELSRVLIEEKGCELIVVACNTATAYAIDHLRAMFRVPFVGVEPYVNYINHAAPEKVVLGNVGALVTPNTLKSERFKTLKDNRDPSGHVVALALGDLAPAIEKFVFHRNRQKFMEELGIIFKNQDVSSWGEVILGCTHYPLVSSHLEELLGLKCISPTQAIVEQMLKFVDTNHSTSQEDYFWYLDTQTKAWRKALLSEFLPLP